MSLRIPLLHLRKFHFKKCHFVPLTKLCLIPTYTFTNYSTSIQTPSPGKSESIYFPKHMQPLVNQSVDEILSNLNPKSISATETVSTLKVLRMFTLFKNINSNDFKSDQRFEILCNEFEKNCQELPPNLLISGLRSLLEVGVPPYSKCVIAAEESVIRNINLFSTFNLIGCLYFHHKFMDTNLQKKVVTVLGDELSKRIPEVTSRGEVLMLVHFLHIFNESSITKMQQKIIELISLLNAHEICKVFNTLAENSNRNISILNALAFQLRLKKDVLQLKEILDIFYSFKKLNFHEMNLISNLMSQIATEIPSVQQSSIISGVLTTCGCLRLRHIGVLNACSEWIINHVEICRPKEFVSFILTIANLNYLNEETMKVLYKILPLITFEKVESLDVWLDYVWSLAILNIVEKEMLMKVLSPNFYKPLVDNSGFQVDSNKLKMMNLKAVLKNYHPECIFSCNLFIDPFEIKQSSEIQNSKKHVLKILSNFVPKDKYINANQSTDMGIFIDAEFIMDKNLKPLPLSDFGVLSKVDTVKELPPGAQRIALIILFYKDFTLCSPSRTGYNDLVIKLLFSQGYTAIPISFDEFIRNNTEVQKAKYLLQRITSIMKKVENNDYKFSIKLFN